MEIIMEFQKEEEALSQQLRTLLATRAGSVPIVRDYGIDWSFLDAPPEVAESLFYQELLSKTEQYLPEIQIKSVTFEANSQNGEMQAKIVCGRRESFE